MLDYKEVEPGKELSKYVKGIAIMNNMAEVLHAQGLLPERFSVSKPKKVQVASSNPLDQIIREAKRGVCTPDLFTNYWRLKLEGVEIPDCDWTAGEIQRPMVDKLGRDIPGLMVPDLEVITLPLLGQMYPGMGNRSVAEDSPVTETHLSRGWIKVYDSVDVPNLNTSKADAEKFAEGQGYLPGREKGYILGSQASKDFHGKYFDQGATWSWLLGSRVGGGVVSAGFSADGRLFAFWYLYDPEVPFQRNGWRFEEVKRA